MAKGKRIPDETKQEAVRLVKSGMAQRTVADRLGISFSTVNDAVRLAKGNPPRKVAAEPKPVIVRVPHLVPGRVYRFREVIRSGWPGRSNIARVYRMRFIKAYPHHALFVNRIGIKRCYQYWDLMQYMMEGRNE